jgi:hypothetical protein
MLHGTVPARHPAISEALAALGCVRAGELLRSAHECFASNARRAMMSTGEEPPAGDDVDRTLANNNEPSPAPL